MRNLIMGVISNYTYDQLKPFILSLEHYNKDTEIIFLTDNTKQEDITKITQHKNIKILGFQNPDKYRLTVVRHFLYLDILSQLKDVDNVMICDTRDVLFQGDPFAHIKNNHMHFFLEDSNVTIGDCQINSEWIYETFGWEEYKRMRHNKISCAGISIGSYKSMINYLNMMTYFLKTTKRCTEDIDQPIHNFLIINNFIKDYEMFTMEKGYLATVGHNKPEDLKFDNAGYLVNINGMRYNIIHQYDRHINIFQEKWTCLK